MHVNLLPDREIQQRTVRRLMRLWVRAWIVAAILVATIIYWQQIRHDDLSGPVARTINQTAHLRELQDEVSLIAREVSTVQQQIDRVLHLIPADNPLLVCDQVCEGLRATDGMVQLTELRIIPVDTSVKQKTLVWTVLVGGMAVHDQAISKLVTTLRDSGMFADVRLQASSHVGVPGGSVRRFQLQCSYGSTL